MDIIPYSLHLPALICLVLFAVYRPSPFPLVLTVTYTAFFHLTHLFEPNGFIQIIIIQSTLASMLLSIGITFGENVRYASRFCLCMLLGILNLILMYSTHNLQNGYFVAAQVFTASLTYTLSIFEFYFLLRMNHDARGARIDTVITNWCLSGLSVFKPSEKSIPLHYWEAKGEG